jgi:hypothetical protein
VLDVEFRRPIHQSEAADYAFRLNLKRRHLSVAQQAAVLVEFGALREAETAAKAKLSEAGKSSAPCRPVEKPPVNSREVTPRHEREAATVATRSVGIGGQAVQRAKTVQQAAPDMFERMKAGEVSVNEAYKEAKASEAAHVKRAALRSGPLDSARGRLVVVRRP